MKYQNGLNHRRRTTLPVYINMLWPEVLQTEEKSRPNVLLRHTSLQL